MLISSGSFQEQRRKYKHLNAYSEWFVFLSFDVRFFFTTTFLTSETAEKGRFHGGRPSEWCILQAERFFMASRLVWTGRRKVVCVPGISHSWLACAKEANYAKYETNDGNEVGRQEYSGGTAKQSRVGREAKKEKKRLRGVKRRAHESVLRKKKKHKSPLSDDKFRFFSIL